MIELVLEALKVLFHAMKFIEKTLLRQWLRRLFESFFKFGKLYEVVAQLAVVRHARVQSRSHKVLLCFRKIGANVEVKREACCTSIQALPPQR